MPYVQNPDDGTRIYYEVEGAGSPLVMLSGFTGSSKTWLDKGFVNPLASDHQLVLIDPRGHGASDGPHDPDAYAPRKDVADVFAVLDEVGIGSAHILGYSMGGTIALAVGMRAPERVRSLVIGGAGPLPPDPSLQFLLDRGVQGLVDVIEASSGEALTDAAREIVLANDVEALIARLMSGTPPLVPDDVLAAMTIPALFYAGTEDASHANASRAAEHMPNAALISLDGLDHLKAYGPFATKLVMPQIKEFLARVDSEVAAAT